MDQPERLPVIAFIIACLSVFFVLYLILGGEDSAIGVKVETSDEILLEDEFLYELLLTMNISVLYSPGRRGKGSSHGKLFFIY